MKRPDERMVWFLKRLASTWYAGLMVAWDSETVDEFVEAFPEAARTLIVFAHGPNSSPMLNRAAKRAHARGYVWPGHIGNEEASRFQQRTWCRVWNLTDSGRVIVAGAAADGRSNT
jgi:hypothetical protein